MWFLWPSDGRIYRHSQKQNSYYEQFRGLFYLPSHTERADITLRQKSKHTQYEREEISFFVESFAIECCAHTFLAYFSLCVSFLFFRLTKVVILQAICQQIKENKERVV